MVVFFYTFGVNGIFLIIFYVVLFILAMLRASDCTVTKQGAPPISLFYSANIKGYKNSILPFYVDSQFLFITYINW